MTYHPDSVLVEKVAEALCEEDGQKWEHVKTDPWEHGFWLRLGECALRVACPLVAGVIADRLDEWVRVMNPDAEFFGGPWDCAGFVRSEYGEQT